MRNDRKYRIRFQAILAMRLLSEYIARYDYAFEITENASGIAAQLRDDKYYNIHMFRFIYSF